LAALLTQAAQIRSHAAPVQMGKAGESRLSIITQCLG